MWRSLVARLLWEQDVAGSNPVIPTIFCGCSSLVEPQPSKLMRRVRFPSPAPNFITTKNIVLGRIFFKSRIGYFSPLDMNLFGVFYWALPSVFCEEGRLWSSCINSVCFWYKANRCAECMERQGPELLLAQVLAVSCINATLFLFELR